jgi:signal transduction histidine kinase/ligand-binding sensor domain-containing protein
MNKVEMKSGKDPRSTIVRSQSLFHSGGSISFSVMLFSVLVFCTSWVLAQDVQILPETMLSSEVPTLRFEQLSLQDGMAQSSGHTITQDSQGYLWIATQGGLHRYDGYDFKIYNSIPFDTTSLSENWVWAANEAGNGDMWVTTEGGGLNRMDPVTGAAVHYRHDPEDSASISSDRTFYPLEASNGDLWVSTLNRGLNRMRAGQEGSFIRYNHKEEDPNSLTSDILFWLSEDAHGHIWASSANGINRIDPETGSITRYLYNERLTPFYGDPENVMSQYIPSGNHGILWLATGNGLVRLDSETGEYRRFLIEPNGDGINPLNFIHDVMPDPNDPNVLWVGGPGTGIARFDMRTETFSSYRHDPRDRHSLSEDRVLSLFLDRSGMMWAGTATEGINVFNPGAVNFNNVQNDPEDASSLAPGNVWGIYEDSRGTLWVGTDVGVGGGYLTQFDAVTGKVTRHRHDPNNRNTLLPGINRAFAEDAAGDFWLGGSGGLNKMDRSTGRVTRFRRERTEENRGRNNVFALKPIANNETQLWVGTIGGLDRFDTQTGVFTPVPLSPDSTAPGPGVLCLWQGTAGSLWIGTGSGLFHLDPAGEVKLASSYDPQDTTSISDNWIQCIIERKEEPGILWLGMGNGGGLNRFDTRTETATHIMKKDGLGDNMVYGILEDGEGTLWMSTNGGISNFDPDTRQFRNYGLDDGLMALEYNQNAYAKGPGGVLYFGSGEGFTAFEPKYLTTNAVPPQVVISDFKLFNKSVVPGPDSPLIKPLSQQTEITVGYDQNEVTFDYVALHFGNPKKNRYAYQLQGFDKDWVEAGSQRSATYTNLSPGDYVFLVKAANADGIWNEKGASVQLTILPPWYRTWWAYILFAGALAIAVFGMDRLQRYRLSKKEQERAALREAELRAEAENKRRADTEELSKIGRAITSTLSVDEIIETVYANVNALMDAAIFGVGVYNEEEDRLDFPATKEEGETLPPYSNSLHEDHWLSIWCFKNRREIVIADFEKEYSRFLTSYSAPIVGKSPNSVLYMPLIQQDRVVGVITTQSFAKNAYSEYHVNLLRNLANYTAIALDNASAYRKLNATLNELQSTQQQLIHSEKMASLGELTAGIAHEIQNPLNFVNNFSEVSVDLIEELVAESAKLKEEKDPELEKEILDDVVENLKKIQHHGQRASSIVKGMLQHSRSGSDKKEPVDINALADEYLRLAYHGLRAKDKSFNADFKTDLDASLPKVELVAQDIGRVLLNLINNAFFAVSAKEKSLPGGEQPVYKPEVSVHTRNMGKHVEIRVRDNADGIPDEVIDKIFQPFFTTKPTGEGTGLGLSLSYDIITKGHGGSIDVKTSRDSGTEFIITIPI